MRARMILVVCVFLACAGLPAEETRRDGTWWNQQSAGFRLLYILGFMDGIDLGHRFSVPEKIAGHDATADARRSYREQKERYFTDVTVGQISDALDAFYRDHRNRAIGLSDGFEIVLRSLKGENVEALVKARRSAAAGK
jgi:hypothetical protein